MRVIRGLLLFPMLALAVALPAAPSASAVGPVANGYHITVVPAAGQYAGQLILIAGDGQFSQAPFTGDHCNSTPLTAHQVYLPFGGDFHTDHSTIFATTDPSGNATNQVVLPTDAQVGQTVAVSVTCNGNGVVYSSNVVEVKVLRPPPFSLGTSIISAGQTLQVPPPPHCSPGPGETAHFEFKTLPGPGNRSFVFNLHAEVDGNLVFTIPSDAATGTYIVDLDCNGLDTTIAKYQTTVQLVPGFSLGVATISAGQTLKVTPPPNCSAATTTSGTQMVFGFNTVPGPGNRSFGFDIHSEVDGKVVFTILPDAVVGTYTVVLDCNGIDSTIARYRTTVDLVAVGSMTGTANAPTALPATPVLSTVRLTG